MMSYIEAQLLFSPPDEQTTIDKGASSLSSEADLNILGINVRIGNRPLVYSLQDTLNTPMQHYLLVHSISATRTRGRARVDELHYTAEAIRPLSLQTLGLVPATTFRRVVSGSISTSAELNAGGAMSIEAPTEFIRQVLPGLVQLAPGVTFEFGVLASFIAQVSFRICIPVVQSAGIGSNRCSWILKPDLDKNPLLGDQLLIQYLSVPSETKQVVYRLSALVKADRGLFWKQTSQSTPAFDIKVNLQTAQHLQSE